MHFSKASINCSRRPQRCRSDHQSALSVETLSSFDDEDVRGTLVVDDGVEERLVGSDDEPLSTFFELESIGHAKNRRVSIKDFQLNFQC